MNDSRRTRIVIDTNQWLRHHGLRSSLGAALLFALQRLNAVVVLPEAVEGELTDHLAAAGVEAVNQVTKNLRVVENLTGSAPELKLPKVDEIEKAVTDRLQELSDVMVREPLDLEQVRRALLRVNTKFPPSKKKEEFRDSLLWEACLILAADGDVHLITEDNDFREGDQLAPELVAEAAELAGSITLHKGIAEALKVLGEQAPDLDYAGLAESLFLVVDPELELILQKEGFRTQALDRFNVEAFATERHGRLALAFDLEVALSDVTSLGDVSREGRVRVTGDAYYEMASGAVAAVDLDRVEVTYLGEADELVRRGTVFIGSFMSSRGNSLRIRRSVGRGHGPEGYTGSSADLQV